MTLKRIKMTQDNKFLIVVILSIAFTLFHSLLLVKTLGIYNQSYTPDEGHYIDMARRLIETGQYSFWGSGPDAYVTPGLPIFLVICMKMFGTGLVGIARIKILQCFLVAISAYLVYLLALQITQNKAISTTSCFLFCFLGHHQILATYMLTETLFLFFELLFFVLYARACKKEKYYIYIASGIALSLAVYVRPLIFIILPFLFLRPFIDKTVVKKDYIKKYFVFCIAFIICMIPWWIRNIITLSQFIPFASQTNPLIFGIVEDPLKEFGFTSASFGKCILLFFKELFTDPLKTLHWILIKKFNIIFIYKLPNNLIFHNLCDIFLSSSIILGFIGILRCFKEKNYKFCTLIFTIFVLATFMFVPTARYSLQYTPVLVIYASYILYLVFKRQDNKSYL